MSLVPYDGSDISDSEEEPDENVTYAIKPVISSTNQQKTPAPQDLPLFDLPKPKNIDIIETEEDDDEFLHKKPQAPLEKKPVQISIPSLSQLEDNDDTIRKFRTPVSAKKTGLFSILPPPKGGGKVTSLIPANLTRPKPQKKPIPSKLLKPVEKKIEEEEVEKVEEENLDFFSLDRKEEPLPESTPEYSTKVSVIATPVIEEPMVGPARPSEIELAESENTSVDLDEKALKALVGSRIKRKFEETEIVDLHETDIRLDNKKWFENALLHGTGDEEAMSIKEVPGGVHKRKHQITYLAQQAKANELALKNTWAANRANRQQTQSKYGF